ncbi:S41 family peptidase [Thiosulfativibrio zosterae]|uniref:Carboxyl-terminal protease n=1 Tax=Thiosulfativibrio zosterae TaxID=2675053 RepID=A0A6F8PQ55_9GAMM|nr:carboxyl-terminal protease [Thiosulfativibrio zosterae]
MKITWAKKGLWGVTGAFLGAFVVLATTVVADKDAPATTEQVSKQLPLKELRAFVEVYERVANDYVEPVDDKKLLEGAISGLLSNLDPHSAYLPPKDYKEMEEHTTGEFGGLGMEVGLEDGFVKVISPIDDTPAQEAGVKAGDLIIKLDEEPTKGKTLNESVKVMRGKPGSTIKLTIVRKGEDKPIELELTRAVIKVKSVKQKLLTDGMGYVRISQFQIRTGEDLTDSIAKLTEENKAPLNGLVLDLRNNPGGVLRAAVQVSDAFLNKGLIVYTKGRVENSQMRFEAENGDVMKGKPIIVLINEGSASASEIVAGALQDQKRALIAGRTSFGKGSVQTLLPLNNGGAIKVTTARYFTPSGRSIQAEGIKPDIKIDLVKVEKREETMDRVKEKDLSGHLDHVDDKKQTVKTEEQTKDEARLKELDETLAKDFELHEALNLLKGMAFTQAMNQAN